MTGVERIGKALRFEPVDRVPVVPEIIQAGLEISGATHRAYSTDPVVMARTVLAAQRYYGYDAVYVSTDNYVLAEAFGQTLIFPEDEPPQLPAHPLEQGYEVPLREFSVANGRIPVILEATRCCREQLSDEIFVKTNIDSAPFSAAACLRGPQAFLMDLYDEDENIPMLLQHCTDAIVAYGVAAAEAGAHGIAFGDSVSGLVNRELYCEYALPYAQQAISRIHKQTGLPVFYHVCGNTAHILPWMMHTGADCVEIDSMVPMSAAKEISNGRCALEGNVSTIAALYHGTPADVRREANACIAAFGNRGGLILSSACEVPRKTPQENILEITRAAVEYPY